LKLRFALFVSVSLALFAVTSAAPIGAIPGGHEGLETRVRAERTESIRPRPMPPAWMDYAKVEAGYRFLDRHRKMAFQVMGMSSLAATFAAKDVTPLLVQTGRLPKDFSRRMKETSDWIDDIASEPKDREDFVAREYKRAVELGQLHASIADRVRKALAWDPSERVPVNGQSFSFVLYTFAWWPVEALIATKSVDPVRDSKDLDAWFHLWSVIGYGMGAPEELLPRTYARAQEIVPMLRTAQYSASGQAVPAGIPVLLSGHIKMIADQIAAQSKAPPAMATGGAIKALADLISLSPGEATALGLDPDPKATLLEYSKRGSVKG